MDNVRVGFIGCGGNARWHMKTVEALPGTTIVAVCDVVEDLARQAADMFKARAYTDLQAMLRQETLQAVYISIPVDAHGEPEQAVIRHGLPFYVEKPVARDMATAQRIARLVARRNLLTAVGYQLRYNDAAQKARAYLAGKTVALAVGKYWSGTGRATIGRWHSQMARSGGQILEQATHTIDMLRYLLGEVVEVQCRSAVRTLSEIDCPDTNIVLMTFASGALGVLTAYWDYDNRDWSHANVVDIVAGQDLVTWRGASLTITHAGQTTEEKCDGASADAVFIEAVRTGDGSRILSPYADGVRSLAVSLAAIQSGQTGRRVRLR